MFFEHSKPFFKWFKNIFHGYMNILFDQTLLKHYLLMFLEASETVVTFKNV